MFLTRAFSCLKTSSSMTQQQADFYLINYAFKVAKLNITKQ